MRREQKWHLQDEFQYLLLWAQKERCPKDPEGLAAEHRNGHKREQWVDFDL